jgi:hypothetical protein
LQVLQGKVMNLNFVCAFRDEGCELLLPLKLLRAA